MLAVAAQCAVAASLFYLLADRFDFWEKGWQHRATLASNKRTLELHLAVAGRAARSTGLQGPANLRGANSAVVVFLCFAAAPAPPAAASRFTLLRLPWTPWIALADSATTGAPKDTVGAS
eukprot:s8169_g2.t1